MIIEIVAKKDISTKDIALVGMTTERPYILVRKNQNICFDSDFIVEVKDYVEKRNYKVVPLFNNTGKTLFSMSLNYLHTFIENNFEIISKKTLSQTTEYLYYSFYRFERHFLESEKRNIENGKIALFKNNENRVYVNI